jgi:hypothetical protein
MELCRSDISYLPEFTPSSIYSMARCEVCDFSVEIPTRKCLTASGFWHKIREYNLRKTR